MSDIITSVPVGADNAMRASEIWKDRKHVGGKHIPQKAGCACRSRGDRVNAPTTIARPHQPVLAESMSKEVASFLFENSVLPPLFSAWLVGYCIIDSEGTVWLTNFGQDYLARGDL